MSPLAAAFRLVAVLALSLPALAAGMVYDLCWNIRHRHLYRHEDTQ